VEFGSLLDFLWRRSLAYQPLYMFIYVIYVIYIRYICYICVYMFLGILTHCRFLFQMLSDIIRQWATSLFDLDFR